jgi:hypothetical protein
MSRPLAVPGMSLLFVCGLLACNDERDRPPLANGSAGPPVAVDMTRGDGGVGHGSHDDGGEPRDDDAGTAIPSTQRECREVDPAPFSGEDPSTGRFFNAVDEPVDLSVTRTLATWGLACERPTIRIALSDGECPDGDGHELTFFLDYFAIENDLIARGANPIQPESEARDIRVRYVRPGWLEPTGEWGNCGPDPSGSVIFKDRIETDAFDWIQAQFQLQLTACDGSDNPNQQLNGSFDVQLRRGVDQACPSP